jgi:hypothetical protein
MRFVVSDGRFRHRDVWQLSPSLLLKICYRECQRLSTAGKQKPRITGARACLRCLRSVARDYGLPNL